MVGWVDREAVLRLLVQEVQGLPGVDVALNRFEEFKRIDDIRDFPCLK